mgnify:CR=1 FL=1
MRYRGRNVRVDWRHVGNSFWLLDDAINWYMICVCLLIIVAAPSFVMGGVLAVLLSFKAWAVNWQRTRPPWT